MSNTIIFNEYSYAKNGEKNGTVYYRCSKYEQKCRVRLVKKGESITQKGVHICGKKVLSIGSSINQINPKEYGEKFLAEKSAQLSLYPNQIYQEFLLTMMEKFVNVAYQMPSKSHIYSIIRQNRGLVGMNSLESVMTPPLSLKRNGEPFFRRYWVGDIHGEQHKILLWSTNESLALMRYNSHTFIDGTFKITPHSFYQCVIVMIYDCGTELYVPCAFGLVTGKNEHIYCELFHQLIMLMEYSWMPRVITTDFEQALISAIKQEFPESKISGCYFHLKQALQRKLKKYKVSGSNSIVILEKVELLTLVPAHEILSAIQYIKTLTTNEDNVNMFWLYFERTWLSRFPPNVWNTFDIPESDFKNRTNNALERYNRRLNDFFVNAHPNICSFAEIIKSEFEYYEGRCKEIRQNSSGILFKTKESQQKTVLKEYNNYINKC